MLDLVREKLKENNMVIFTTSYNNPLKIKLQNQTAPSSFSSSHSADTSFPFSSPFHFFLHSTHTHSASHPPKAHQFHFLLFSSSQNRVDRAWSVSQDLPLFSSFSDVLRGFPAPTSSFRPRDDYKEGRWCISFVFQVPSSSHGQSLIFLFFLGCPMFKHHFIVRFPAG